MNGTETQSVARNRLLQTLLLALVVALPAAATASPVRQPAARRAESGSAHTAGRTGQIVENYGKLPLRFEANQGQADKSVKFFSRGLGYGIYLKENEAVLALRGHDSKSGASTDADIIRMRLDGANPKSEPAGDDLLAGQSNYLLGNDPEKWHLNVPAFGKVRYADIYPGVDLVYYGNHQKLEYDFVVAPGADSRQIRLRFSGTSRLELDDSGNLIVQAADGKIVFDKPVLYQVVGGRRQPVDGQFTLLDGDAIGVRVGDYDRSRRLVIDPTLVYSTYLGGSSGDLISSIAVDSSGAAYLSGTTTSTDFPVTPGVIQATDNDGHGVAFVTKLNASGTALIYSTFLGGSGAPFGGDSAKQVAVDSAGEAFVAGTTCSSDFPVTKAAYQAANNAAAKSACTGFVSKLSASGTALVYSTYLGGTGQDAPSSIALDSAGDAYVAGGAYSSDFPTTAGVIQTANNSANDDGWNEFITKMNPAGTALIYSTYLGGSGDYGGPAGIHVAVDKSGDAYVSGIALSTDFPVTTGAYQNKNNGASGHSNMTLSELNPTATKLLYSTYLGGSGNSYGDDVANGLVVDASGNTYLCGITFESNFPVTKGALQTSSSAVPNGAAAGFVTKMNSTGTALGYSTYLGGSGGLTGDRAFALAVDGAGDAFITGSADSTDFPVTGNAYQKTNPAAFNNGAVVFLTELNPTGSALTYSTYFGGSTSFSDAGYGIALGSQGAVYLAGTTGATDFPITPGAFDSTLRSVDYTTGFVSQFTLGTGPATLATTANLTASPNPAVTGQEVTFIVTVVPVKGTAIPAGNVVFSIDEAKVATVALNSKGSATYTTKSPLKPGNHAILASYSGNATYSASANGLTEAITPASPSLSPAGGVYSSALLVTLADATPGTALYYTANGSAPTASATKYTVPILVVSSEIIRVVAISGTNPGSAIVSASYTVIDAPSALAAAATIPSTTSATLNGLVNTYGLAGTYYFQYGTSSTALTLSTPKKTLSGSTLGSKILFAPVAVSASVTGLKTQTKYFYQVVVTTAAGTSSGAVLSVTTK